MHPVISDLRRYDKNFYVKGLFLMENYLKGSYIYLYLKN